MQTRAIPTTNVPITTNGIVLSGPWSKTRNTYGTTNVSYPAIGTGNRGNSISFPLTYASAFYITGSVNWNHGNFIVTVTPPPDFGSQLPTSFSGLSRWVGLDATLYLGTGLNRSQTYQVKVTDDDPSAGHHLDMNEIVIFDTPP